MRDFQANILERQWEMRWEICWEDERLSMPILLVPSVLATNSCFYKILQSFKASLWIRVLGYIPGRFFVRLLPSSSSVLLFSCICCICTTRITQDHRQPIWPEPLLRAKMEAALMACCNATLSTAKLPDNSHLKSPVHLISSGDWN